MSFRLANLDGRAVLLDCDSNWYDLERHSDGRYAADITQVIPEFTELTRDADALITGSPDGTLAHHDRRLRPLSPQSSKILAIGLNYAPHAAESKLELPDYPMVFPKFPNSLTGPYSEVKLPSASVDWEVELVLVIGRRARYISEDEALHYVAGATVGQDISDRHVQMLGNPPQFGLGKSFDTFAPIGPHLVSLDQLDGAADLHIWCDVNGERLQDARTADMIFSPARLVSYLSHVATLEPGDLIFTGTPSGVGLGFTPPRYLKPGDVIECGIEGIGTLRNECTTDERAYAYYAPSSTD